jgi:hypothetical protein
MPLINFDTTRENDLSALGRDLPNLDPLPDTVAGTLAFPDTVADLGSILDLDGLL